MLNLSKKQIASTWDKIAKTGAYRRRLWPKAKEFLASKQMILDVGSGNASYLKPRDIKIDISFEMCKLAKPNALCADATVLPIKANSFLKVASIATIHHLPSKQDRLDFLKEIKRVLKPKGEALITAWYEFHIFKNAYKKWGDIKRFYHFFTQRELNKLASQVFSNFKIEVESSGNNKNLYLHIVK